MAAAVAAVSSAAPGECLNPPHALARKLRNAAAEWGSTYWSEATLSVRPGLLGHSDVKTIMIYTHKLNRGVVGVKSPAGLLFS